MFRLLASKPVATLTNAFASTNVTTAAWVQLVASALQPSSSIEIFNGSNSILKLATGGSGAEVAFPYSILPGGSAILLPMEFPKGARISIKAVDATANSGSLVLNFFG